MRMMVHMAVGSWIKIHLNYTSSARACGIFTEVSPTVHHAGNQKKRMTPTILQTIHGQVTPFSNHCSNHSPTIHQAFHQHQALQERTPPKQFILPRTLSWMLLKMKSAALATFSAFAKSSFGIHLELAMLGNRAERNSHGLSAIGCQKMYC